MESMAIANRLTAQFPGQILQCITFHGQTGVVVQPARLVDILRWLRDTPDISMNHLRSLCGVDNARRKEPGLARFEVVYNLYSTLLRHELRLRAEIDSKEPAIDSVVSLWPSANWLERETYDLMGIRFTGHPDLCRVLLPDDWQGHPLRKEYSLKGKGEWRGLTALQENIKELDSHGFHPGQPVETRKGASITRDQEEGA